MVVELQPEWGAGFSGIPKDCRSESGRSPIFCGWLRNSDRFVRRKTCVFFGEEPFLVVMMTKAMCDIKEHQSRILVNRGPLEKMILNQTSCFPVAVVDRSSLIIAKRLGTNQ